MDSYKYLNRITRIVIKAWPGREPQCEICWAPVRKPDSAIRS